MSSEPKVFVGMPFYGAVTPHAVLSGCMYASETPKRIAFKVMGGSFHCWNFNSLWCAALNSRKDYGWTHFAMIHQDVHPARWWVDTLINELARSKADVLSVVLPQKDECGITSTGVLDPVTLRTTRLTINQVVKELPVTFASGDLHKVGLPDQILLISSGLWIADFSKPWVEDVWFEAPSRIIKNPQTGDFESHVWSEDWNFAVQLAAHGARVASTRIVTANHLGGGRFGNQEAWGEWDTDQVEPSDCSWVIGRADEQP